MTEVKEVLPADYVCPWCRHPLPNHNSIGCSGRVRDAGCKCDVSSRRLRRKARRWVRQTNKRLRQEAKATQKAHDQAATELLDLESELR